MKVKDLIKMDVDIEIDDNVCQEIGLSFVGPIKLTKEGEEEFKDVLEYEVTLYEDHYWASVKCDDQEPEIKWLEKFKKTFNFFKACAGYCSIKDYDKWFKGVD